MSRFAKPLLISSCVLAVTACSQREIGANLSSGDFGAATARNTIIQTQDMSYVRSLNAKFIAQVPATLNFEFGSAALDTFAKNAIRQQADYINQFPEVSFSVYGHTDLVGSVTANKRLGLKRARAVVDELVRNGVDRDRLEALVSFGETMPLIASQDRERANRRTVTEVSGFVQSNPLVIDSRYAEIVNREYIESATAESRLSASGDLSSLQGN